VSSAPIPYSLFPIVNKSVMSCEVYLSLLQTLRLRVYDQGAVGSLDGYCGLDGQWSSSMTWSCYGQQGTLLQLGGVMPGERQCFDYRKGLLRTRVGKCHDRMGCALTKMRLSPIDGSCQGQEKDTASTRRCHLSTI